MIYKIHAEKKLAVKERCHTRHRPQKKHPEMHLGLLQLCLDIGLNFYLFLAFKASLNIMLESKYTNKNSDENFLLFLNNLSFMKYLIVCNYLHYSIKIFYS